MALAKSAQLQDDPDVKIPKAVREQAERSNEIIRQLNEANGAGDDSQTGDPAPDDGQPPLTGDPVVDPAVDPATNPTEPPDEPATGDPAPEPPTAPTAPAMEDDKSWEHKYNSMHGRYMAMKDQVNSLSQQVVNLQNVIAAMQTPPPVVEVPAERLITPEEESDYGQDLLNVVGKRAREELNPLLTKAEQRIASLEAKLNGHQARTEQEIQQKLLDTLDEKLPTWREINTNEDFIAWLALPDAYSGAIRHDMLKTAYAQGNASRVLAFFNGFLSEEAATTPAGGAEPDPSTVRVPKIPLAELAAPGKAKTAAATGAPAEKPIITRAQIAAFYAEVAAGKYRGRDKEKLALEQVIFSAQHDGRIR